MTIMHFYKHQFQYHKDTQRYSKIPGHSRDQSGRNNDTLPWRKGQLEEVCFKPGFEATDFLGRSKGDRVRGSSIDLQTTDTEDRT